MRKPSAKRETFRSIYRAYIARLVELGCVLCPRCYCYMPADHACADAAAVPARKAA